MNAKLFLSLGLAALMVIPSCTVDKNLKNGEVTKSKKVSFLAGSNTCNCENGNKENKKKAKYPAIFKNKIKAKINYETKISGGNQVYKNLLIGEFQAKGNDVEFYATLAKNGLVTVTSKAVKQKDSDEYVTWLNVEMTDLGKSYIYSTSDDNTLIIGKDDYYDLFNPEKDRDEYGALIEDPNISEDARALLSSFYKSYVTDEAKAVQRYGEEELIDAYKRMATANSYCKQLKQPLQIFDNAFTYGKAVEDNIFAFYRLPKYKNAYKVVFDGGYTIVITDDAAEKIFDVVVDRKNGNKTFKQVNKSIADGVITALYERTKANNVKVPVLPNPKHYAPGLVARSWKDSRLELADRGGDENLLQNKLNKNAIAYLIQVRLYSTEIDKIHKISKSAEEADKNKFGSYDKYYAKAEVILKKIDVTPFQFIMQRFGKAVVVDKKNTYTKEYIDLEYYKDCGWSIK